MPGITFTTRLKNKKWVLILRGGTEAVPYRYIHELSAVKYYRDLWYTGYKEAQRRRWSNILSSKPVKTYYKKKGHNENITRINEYIYKGLDVE